MGTDREKEMDMVLYLPTDRPDEGPHEWPELRSATYETRMRLMKFKEAMEPAVKWFNKNCNPHQRIIIEAGGVELVSGEMAFPTAFPD